MGDHIHTCQWCGNKYKEGVEDSLMEAFLGSNYCSRKCKHEAEVAKKRKEEE